MRRREFVTLLGGAAAWPLTAKAQQKLRRIGVLFVLSASDPENQARLAIFIQGLRDRGWTEGHNIQFDVRYGDDHAQNIRLLAQELVRSAPDVIFVSGTSATRELHLATAVIPVVFVNAADPVAAGIIKSLAGPGSNITGFTNVEMTTTGKWIQLLVEIAPQTSQALLLLSSRVPTSALRLPVLESAAKSFGLNLTVRDVNSPVDIIRAIDAASKQPNLGIVVFPSPVAGIHRETIISTVAERRIPAVYPYRYFAESGGLIAYGTDIREQCRQAAGYVDRIMKGTHPSDLATQQPSKFELVINLKTARALGLKVPPSLLANADEVIE
jgi:putative tryptophan/tyrosine transport system substrate-binding protein